MDDNPTISKLTSHPAAHILYIFNEDEKYIGNAVSFILEGIEKNEVILFVDTEELVGKVKEELKAKGLHPTHLQNLIFADSKQTYLNGKQFDLEKSGELIKLLHPYLDEGYRIRTWGQVPIPDHESTLERLRIFECNSNEFICKSSLISVCAYNGLSTPAYVQNELLKTHTHFMTDTEYSLSPFYSKEHLQLPTAREKERLRKLEKQNKELEYKNHTLSNEINLVKMRNSIITHNEQKFRMIINQLPIPVIIRRKSTMLFHNDQANIQFSIDSCNRSVDHILNPFFEKYDKELGIYHNNSIQQHQFIVRNDKKKHFLVKSIDMIFEGESAIFHSLVDISQEKENEKLIVRSEKMNIAGELSASIAHELRNPLTAIKGFFQLLKGEGTENEMYYGVIESELSRIEQIASELLTLAKPHSESRKNHNIIQLIEDVKLLLTSESNMKNINLILQIKSEELYISCEDTKIKQVFINLIKNAIDSMESGGNIIIKVNGIRDNIEIQVIDQGIGIPKELLKRVGEPFYTTKEKGTGIGLMVCFQIIESHKGTIDVASEVGLGTTFTITLPALKESVVMEEYLVKS
jgi:two-component system, sporulation sensor kinase A